MPTNARTLPASILTQRQTISVKRLPVAGVEVVPLVAGAAPVVVRSPVVGLVVGVLGLLVVEAGGLLVVTSLGVKGRSLLAVEGVEHFGSVCWPGSRCPR